MKPEQQQALLRRFEPILRYTQGERFFPMDVARYVEQCSLWVQPRRQPPERLYKEGELSLEKLAQPHFAPFDSVQYLKFIEPLNITQLAAYRLRQGLDRLQRRDVFHAGPGRLARVGYGSRFLDAIFSLTLLARGRVPGDTAAAAAVSYERLRQKEERYIYYARVVEEDGWLVLQYWFFYPFNNWRSGFYGLNDHEGDWEMVSLYLYEEKPGHWEPEWVAYASHEFEGDDLRRRWDDPELERVDDHPVVYAGAGSHASYFRAGEYLAELEIPLLSPLLALINRGRTIWGRLIRSHDASYLEDAHIFRVPFVDFARGDGVSIGPGQDKAWDEPQLISPAPAWVSDYRGLWGLWARDPVMGENAPGGPMYNQLGRVRRAWYNPLGWAGLDRYTAPSQKADGVARRRQNLDTHREALALSVAEKTRELRALGLEANAMLEQPHMRAQYSQRQNQMALLAHEIDELRRELAEDEVLDEALELYQQRIAAGHRSPARLHIRRPLQPASPLTQRLSRIAEAWAAVSIGLMLVAFVGAVLFAPHYLLLGAAATITVIAVVEAIFRRRLQRLITAVTNTLAFISLVVLLFEFFWQILIGLVLLAGAYIMWENLRELWS